MSTVALSHDWAPNWAQAERRRQRAVILLLLLLVLLLAFAPRNERRLFVFAGPAQVHETIELPEPTLLRTAILEQVFGPDAESPPVPDVEPTFYRAEPDNWQDGLFDPNILMPAVDEAFLLSDLPKLPKPKPTIRRRRVFRHMSIGGPFLFGSPAAATGPVPEPASWALLILGMALVGARMRSAARARSAPS